MTLEDLYGLLRNSHVQLQGIVDTLQEPIVVLDQSLTVITANPAFYGVFKTDRESTLGRHLVDLGNGQWNVAELRTLLEAVLPKVRAVVGYEMTHDFPGLGRRTMLVSARTLAHPHNNSNQLLVVFEDVTARQKEKLAKDVLLAETRHRMKNLFGIIRAIARQTDASGKTGEQYRDAFMGRFEALMTAQSLIADEAETDLHALVRKVVEPLAGRRYEILASPAVGMSEFQVTPMSMILHELSTNALKYGALSNDGGTVHIEWTVETRAGRGILLLNWREVGGPVVAPPSRHGYGMELIDYSCRAEGGDARLDFDPDGLRARISFAVTR